MSRSHEGPSSRVSLARLLLAVALVGPFGLCPRSALADRSDLESALRAYRAGELDTALSQLEAALRRGRGEPEELATIHLHLGVLRGAMGELAEAHQSFAAALAIDPSLQAPEELGGEPRRVFERVRVGLEARAVEVVVRTDDGLVRNRDCVVDLDVLNAPLGLVAALRVTVAVGDGVPTLTRLIEGTGPASITVPADVWPPDSEARLQAAALDQHGNVVARVAARESEPRLGPFVAPDPVPQPSPPRQPWYRNPWLWVGVAAVVVAGTVTGAVLGTAENRYTIESPYVSQ